MVLVDAGCQYYGYVSDITRTWPVSGSFTPAQRDLYQIVMAVKQECIEVRTHVHTHTNKHTHTHTHTHTDSSADM